MTIPADRPQYASGTPVPLGTVDPSTAEFSRGLNPATGAKGAEPAEPVPTIASRAPATALAAAGGTVVTLTGDNFGGSTGANVGGTPATAVTVQSETSLTLTTPAKLAGTYALIVENPAGNSAGLNVTYA